MKGIKKEYIILAAIIVILLVFLLLQKQDKVHYTVPVLDPVQKEDIDKIEIKQPDNTINLVKKDNQWVIDPQGYPTDKEKVEKIIEVLTQLTLTDLASKAKNYTLYDLTDDKAVNVKAFKKDVLVRDFAIGKIASTYGHTFVKLSDNPNVYYARESFRSNFDMKTSELRDKKVLTLDSNEISEFQIEKDAAATIFAKNVKPVELPAEMSKPAEDKKTDDKKAEEPPKEEPKKPEEEITWLTPDGKKGKKTLVDGLINQLTNLTCEEYIEGKTKDDFKAETPIYTLKLKGTKEYVISFFPKIEKKESEDSPGVQSYPAISSENAYPFLVGSWKADQIMKKPEDLLEDAAKEAKK